MSVLDATLRRLASFSLLAAVTACTDPAPPAPPPPPVEPYFAYDEAIGPEPGAPAQYHVAEMRWGDAFSTCASRVDVNGREVDELVRALDGYVDFTRCRPGQWFEIERDAEGTLTWFRYNASITDKSAVYRGPDGALVAYKEPVAVRTATVTVSGEVDWSLYAAMDAIGEEPWLTLTLVDIFAWDVDFFTETQKGDRFAIVVEKRYVGDKFIGYGNVLGAEYAFADRDRKHRAFRYAFEDGKVGFYQANGKAVEKAFLKSPIKFASITSRYGMRRHPILKYVRAHRGVDYGAPSGTAIWSVGDGVVTYAGRKGGYGRVVFIRHANGLSTRYAHLRGLGSGIRRGVRVRQKQTIGYVGQSGLATGPHLHFELLRGGRHMNPLALVSPPAPPIPEEQMERFLDQVSPWVEALGTVTSTQSDDSSG